MNMQCRSEATWEVLRFENAAIRRLNMWIARFPAVHRKMFPALKRFSRQVGSGGPDFNLIPDAGADWISAQLGSAASGLAKFLAISSDVTTPASGDTVLGGELTTNNLGRMAATYAHTPGNRNFTLTTAFTYTGSAVVQIKKWGLLSAISSGSLISEALTTGSPQVSNSGDVYNLVLTFNF